MSFLTFGAAAVTFLVTLSGLARAADPVGSPPGGARALQPGQIPSTCTEADGNYNSSGATYGYYWSERSNQWVAAPQCYARWGLMHASPSQIIDPGDTVTATAIHDDGSMAGHLAVQGGMSWSYPGTAVSGCGTKDVTCTVTIGQKGVRPQEWSWHEFHISGPGRVFILPPSYAPRCQPDLPCLDTRTNAWTYVGISPDEPPTADLEASVRATPATLFLGDRFTLRMTVTNPSEVTLSDVMPAPEVTQTGEGAARLVSGPTPASVATLGAGASATFVWEFESTEGGSLVLRTSAEARTPDDEVLTANATCGVGAETQGITLAEGDGETCPLGGGTRVSIESCDASQGTAQSLTARDLAGVPQADAPSGAAFRVTSTDDDPDDAPGNGKCHTAADTCTLRAAIMEANSTPTPDTITFAIPGSTPTIRPTAPLPDISAPVVLDGAACGKKLELDGSGAGGGDGLVLSGGNSTVRGIVINRFGRHGVVMRGDGNQIYDSIVGAGPDGKCAQPCGLGNRGSGVWIEGSGNVVGNGGLANQVRNGPYRDVPKNTLSFNGDDGVTVKTGTRNNVGGNDMARNGDLAIDLGGDGVDKNDRDDADAGPNDRLNSPVVLAAKKVGTRATHPATGATLRSGALYRGKPDTNVTAIVYGLVECDRADHASADHVVRSTTFSVSAQGEGDPAIQLYETDFAVVADVAGVVYAVVDVDGNTSELSNCAFDKDGDAINDFWEESGADLDRDGMVDLPLHEMGASPTRPDVFVEVDATGASALDDEALDRVRGAFRDAPVTNPLDGSTGVQLHIDNGPGSEMFPGTTWGTLSRADVLPHVDSVGTFDEGDEYAWDDVYKYKRQNMDAARVPFFHYVLATAQIGADDDGTLGISNGIGGSELILGLGTTCPQSTRCPGSPDLQAGTFMHELGHNLGLRHGGSNHDNWKPNYLSVMNYSFVPGVVLVGTDDWHLDYSRVGSSEAPGADGAVGDLDEGHLTESAGLPTTGDAANYSSMYRCANQVDEDGGGGFTRIDDLSEPIDWDCDGEIDAAEIAVDVTADKETFAMSGYTDWPYLVYKGGSIGKGAYETPPEDLTPSQPMPAAPVLAAARALQRGGEPPIVKLRGPRRGKGRARFTLTVRSQLPLGGITTMVDGDPQLITVPKPLRTPRRKKKAAKLGYRYRVRFVVQGAGQRAVSAFVTDRAMMNSKVAAAKVTLR